MGREYGARARERFRAVEARTKTAGRGPPAVVSGPDTGPAMPRLAPTRFGPIRLALLASLCAAAFGPAARAQGAALGAPVPLVAPGVTGTVLRFAAVASAHVAARTVDVWLPPGYDADTTRAYPVLYLHDGQNQFDPAASYTGVDWGVDEALTALIAVGAVEPPVVVAVWNTPFRRAEYMPQRAVAGADTLRSEVPGAAPGLRSDAYLRFLVEELKPAIDARFRTRRGPEATFAMGASMGGLVSAYAVAAYPGVFGGAACVSTHWPALGGAAAAWLPAALPAPGAHRLYFDYGTETLDAAYAPFQAAVDAALAARGWAPGPAFASLAFPGADHSERSWRARVHVPLLFLLGPAADAASPRGGPSGGPR